jgi:hypothetical protein
LAAAAACGTLATNRSPAVRASCLAPFLLSLFFILTFLYQRDINKKNNEEVKMKQKKFGKKLNLNKKTITHLDNEKMKGANGGGDSKIWICQWTPYSCHLSCLDTDCFC